MTIGNRGGRGELSVAPCRSHVNGGTFGVGGRVTIKMAVVLSPKKDPFLPLGMFSP